MLQNMLQLLLGLCYLLQFMLKCAMARLPNQPYLLTLYSNFIIEVRRVLCMICRGVMVSSVCPADRWVLNNTIYCFSCCVSGVW
jgi:hypothetical protein